MVLKMKAGIFFLHLLAQSQAGVANINNIPKRQTSSTRSTFTSATSSAWTRPTNLPPLTVNSTDLDLSTHFCRLWRHQSVYADGKIYIDGGNTYVPNNNATFNTATSYEQGMNDMILVLDLSRNFTNQDTFPYSAVHKSPSTPNTLIEGALWYSSITRKIYQLGGWFSYNNKADPGYVTTPSAPAIWEFDIDTQTFEETGFNMFETGGKVQRPGAAAYCDAPTLNKNFIFEGYTTARSDPVNSNYSLGSAIDFNFIEGMLQLDTNTSPPTLSNISVPTYIGQRMNGAMVHVPVGKQGVIVQIAGQEPQFPTQFGVQVIGANTKNTNINNTYVDIYDIETGFWFRQPTFAPTSDGWPTGRSDICTIVATASDKTSYNIFMIAGVQNYDSAILYEDMWVLSIPTFQWVKVHNRPGGITGHSCHAVGENVVIVGGMQVGTDNKPYQNCSSHMPAEIFSLVELEYTGVFDFEGASRIPPVPAAVVNVIGGTASGAAVNLQPSVWADTYLQYVFNPALTRPASYKPTYTLAADNSAQITTTPSAKPSAKTKVPIGAIVGGAVGGVIVLTLLGALIFILINRRKASSSAPRSGHSELPSYQDSKDAPVVNVSDYTPPPLQFTPYQPYQRDPAEMDADEAMDQWRPLSENNPERSPAMRSATRFSEVSVGSMGSPVSEGGRVSRQSEVSE